MRNIPKLAHPGERSTTSPGSASAHAARIARSKSSYGPSTASARPCAASALVSASASFGVALLATILTNRLTANDAVLGDPRTLDGTVTAFHEAFFASAILSVIGLVACFLIDDKEAEATMVRTREGPEAVPTAPGVPTPGAAELPRASPGGD